jgi:ubiquinone/menaquinone biosynthesis C-methylase UbiE
MTGSGGAATPLAGEKDFRVGAPAYRELKQDVAAAYNRAASRYDQVGTRRFQHFGRELVDRLEVAPAAQCLDVATGRGAILFPLAERVGAAGRVIGVDLAYEMVAETNAEARRRGVANAVLLQMDADALAWAPERFDVVTCGFALFFVDFDHVLPRLHRLLKPGGTLAVSVNHSAADPQEYDRWKWLFPLLRQVMGPGFRPPPACIAPLRLGTPERLEAALEQAGFVDIRLAATQATFYFADEHDWWQHELSQGSRLWSDGMSAAARKRYKQQAFEHLREMKEEAGIRVVDGAMLAYARKPGPAGGEAGSR